MTPIPIKIHANFLFWANPGFVVIFRNIPNASIKAAKIIPNIIDLLVC